MSIIQVCPLSFFVKDRWKLIHELKHVFTMNDLYGCMPSLFSVVNAFHYFLFSNHVNLWPDMIKIGVFL